MRLCWAALIVTTAYISVVVALFVAAALHPSGVGYEFLPSVYLTYPSILFFQSLCAHYPPLFDIIDGDFGLILAGMLTNAIAIYFIVSSVSHLRSKNRPVA